MEARYPKPSVRRRGPALVARASPGPDGDEGPPLTARKQRVRPATPDEVSRQYINHPDLMGIDSRCQGR